MRGGAQAHLIEADDGNFYVVKFLNNPQHRRILINELIGSTILRYLQLAVPEPAVISISEDFLARHPDVSIELGTRRARVAAGWHFGSQFPGDPERLAVYDFVPDTLLRQVNNLAHFRGALVADKWMANSDMRQAIYFRARIAGWAPAAELHPRKVGFVACMIDQGFLFNGPHWDFPDSPLQGLAARPVVYESVRSLEDFQPWLDRVVNLPEDVVDQARRQVPLQWLDGDGAALDGLLERLLRRRSRVPGLIEQCRRARTNLFPNWR
ncbi:MAG: HipA family kinase [Bryobacteraceae bacterium]